MWDDTMKAAPSSQLLGFSLGSALIKNRRAGCVFILTLALVVFLAATVNAQQAKQTAKSSKPAKTTAKGAPPPVQLTLEHKAMEILKAACDRLAAARSMSFTAVVTEESPSRLGTPLGLHNKIGCYPAATRQAAGDHVR